MLLAAQHPTPWPVAVGIFVFIFAVLAIVLRMSWLREHARIEAWRRWAKERGFQFDEPGGSWWIRRSPARIRGQLEDLAFVFDTQHVQRGKAHIVYNRLIVLGPSIAPSRVLLRANTFLARASRYVGANPLPTGDARFDERFWVTGAPFDGLRAIFNDRAREALLALERLDDLTLAQGSLTLRWRARRAKSISLDLALAAGIAPWLGARTRTR